MNGLDNVRLHQIAVGNHRGTTTLFLAADNQGDHSLHGSGKRRPSARVPLTTLDAHFGALPSAPCFLKARYSRCRSRPYWQEHDISSVATTGTALSLWNSGLSASWPPAGPVLSYLDAIEISAEGLRDPMKCQATCGAPRLPDLAEAARGDLRPGRELSWPSRCCQLNLHGIRR